MHQSLILLEIGCKIISVIICIQIVFLSNCMTKLDTSYGLEAASFQLGSDSTKEAEIMENSKVFWMKNKCHHEP